jgi:DNA transformation protein
MAASNEFATHCLELLSPLGPARSRRMFGGHGFYVDDLFIGIAAAERLYLKVDDDSRPRFEAAGCEPFDFDTKDGKRVVLGFWSAPDDALESPVLMQPWGRMAMQAALKALNAKKPAKKAAQKVAARKTTVSPAPAPAARTTAGAAKKKPVPKR